MKSIKIEQSFGLNDKNISNATDTINLPRHRWYYYKEGFSPNLVETAIKELRLSKDDLIIDPFNGSGTVTLTCALKGIPSIGVEVNPFTAFIAKTKTLNVDANLLGHYSHELLRIIETDNSTISPWIGISTFTEYDGVQKWLFNREVADAYECGFCYIKQIPSLEIRDILKLALISALMSCSNARRDGKCFKYRKNWQNELIRKSDFINSLEAKLRLCNEDVKAAVVIRDTDIVNTDSRVYLEKEMSHGFSLCITSPPYLNTFDYTDIYRPELFMGGFIPDNKSLYNLRLKTIRSHVQALWKNPEKEDFGSEYNAVMKYLLQNQDLLMCKRIPLMIQAYFEDMQNILYSLYSKARENAQIWLVVSTSAYAGKEVPVDVIIGKIGERCGFELLRIVKLRDIRKRKTKYSGEVNFLRESLVVFKR